MRQRITMTRAEFDRLIAGSVQQAVAPAVAATKASCDAIVKSVDAQLGIIIGQTCSTRTKPPLYDPTAARLAQLEAQALEDREKIAALEARASQKTAPVDPDGRHAAQIAGIISRQHTGSRAQPPAMTPLPTLTRNAPTEKAAREPRPSLAHLPAELAGSIAEALTARSRGEEPARVGNHDPTGVTAFAEAIRGASKKKASVVLTPLQLRAAALEREQALNRAKGGLG